MFQLHFYTDAGGCCKSHSFGDLSKNDVIDILCEDLMEDPYINFWYGQHIELDFEEYIVKEIQDYITMKLQFDDGKIITSMDELDNVDCDCEDECFHIQLYEQITNDLFNITDYEKFINNAKDTIILTFDEFKLEYNIDYDFFKGFND